MVPLQMGLPGGPELLVILLIMLVLFGIPLLLIGVGGFVYFRSKAGDDTEERIAELETEIDHLKSELDAERDEEPTASDGDAHGDDPQVGD